MLFNKELSLALTLRVTPLLLNSLFNVRCNVFLYVTFLLNELLFFFHL